MTYTFTTNDFWLMVQGAGITFLLTIIAGVIGTFMGFLIGWARTTKNVVFYYLLIAYVDIIRSIPLIIQFVLFNSFMAIAGYPMDPFISGIITLSIYISGYVAEVVKAGIESVPSVTRKAARGLGMTYYQDFFYVVLPIGNAHCVSFLDRINAGFDERYIIDCRAWRNTAGIVAFLADNYQSYPGTAHDSAWRRRFLFYYVLFDHSFCRTL